MRLEHPEFTVAEAQMMRLGSPGIVLARSRDPIVEGWPDKMLISDIRQEFLPLQIHTARRNKNEKRRYLGILREDSCALHESDLSILQRCEEETARVQRRCDAVLDAILAELPKYQGKHRMQYGPEHALFRKLMDAEIQIRRIFSDVRMDVFTDVIRGDSQSENVDYIKRDDELAQAFIFVDRRIDEVERQLNVAGVGVGSDKI